MAQKYPAVEISDSYMVALEKPFSTPNGYFVKHLACFDDENEQATYYAGFASDHTTPVFLIPIIHGDRILGNDEIGQQILHELETLATA